MNDNTQVPLWGTLLALAIGLGLLGVFLRNFWRAQKSRGWPTAPGRILESAFTYDEGYSLAIAYEYTVNGVVRRGERVRFASNVYTFRRTVTAILARYPVGAPVRVLYDPINPALCVLEGRFDWLDWAPILFFALAILVPWTWMSVHPGGARQPKDRFAAGALGNPAGAEAALRKKFALHDVERLDFFPNRVTICVRDLRDPQHHDLYDLTSGAFGDARPSPHPCTPRFAPTVRRSPTGDTFRLGDVDFAVLNKIVADARRRNNLAAGALTHLVVGRSNYEAVRETIVTVFISGTSGGQALDYDLQGTYIDNLGQYNRTGIGPRPWAQVPEPSPR